MWSVFKKTFRDSRASTLWLSIGLAVYALMVISMYPAIVQDANMKANMEEMLDSYPDSLKAFFQGMDNFTEPANWLHVQFTLWMMLLMGAIVIWQAFSAVTNAERDGTLDVMLSLPISRREMLLGKLLANVAQMLTILTACYVTLVGCAWAWPEFDLSPLELAVGVYVGFIPLLVTAGVAYVLAVFLPSSKRWGGAIAYLFLYGSYLLHSLAGTSPKTADWKPIFMFEYYNVPDIVHHGLRMGNISLLLVGVALCALAWWQIDRKELGV